MTNRINIDETKLTNLFDLLNESTEHIRNRDSLKYREGGGFNPLPNYHIKRRIRGLKESDVNLTNFSSLDLGSGLGSWALITAACGIHSYGIELDPYLVDIAYQNKEKAIHQGLIDPTTHLEFMVGNIYPEKYREDYLDFERRNSYRGQEYIPTEFNGDPYANLGIQLDEIGIIYSFVCEDQIPFLSRVLEEETSPGTIYIIPYGLSEGLERKVQQIPKSDHSDNMRIRMN